MKDHPQNTNYLVVLASAHTALGTLAALGVSSPEDAAEHLKAADRLAARVVLEHPEIAYGWYTWRLAVEAERAHWLSLGRLDSRLRGTTEKLAWLESHRPRFHKTDEEMRFRLRVDRADALRALGRPAEALAVLETTSAAAGLNAALAPSKERSRLLAEALLAAGRGDATGAESLAEKARGVGPEDGALLYDLAAVAARCAGTATPAALADRQVARAVELLKRPLSARFPSPLGPRRLLTADPAFDAVREKEASRKFLADLPGPALPP